MPKNWDDQQRCMLLQTATVVVGEDCDVEVAVRYGSSIGNYTCAGQATQELDAR